MLKAIPKIRAGGCLPLARSLAEQETNADKNANPKTDHREQQHFGAKAFAGAGQQQLVRARRPAAEARWWQLKVGLNCTFSCAGW